MVGDNGTVTRLVHIDHKTQSIAEQFALINPRLRAVLLEAAYYSQVKLGITFMITSLHRPDNDKSVHYYWCGGDGRTFTYTEEQANELCNHLNKHFCYDDNHKTCIIHDVGMGRHFHIQVKPK